MKIYMMTRIDNAIIKYFKEKDCFICASVAFALILMIKIFLMILIPAALIVIFNII